MGFVGRPIGSNSQKTREKKERRWWLRWRREVGGVGVTSAITGDEGQLEAPEGQPTPRRPSEPPRRYESRTRALQAALHRSSHHCLAGRPPAATADSAATPPPFQIQWRRGRICRRLAMIPHRHHSRCRRTPPPLRLRGGATAVHNCSIVPSSMQEYLHP